VSEPQSLPPSRLSASALEQGFADDSSKMLEDHTGLGVHILVLSNAAFDAGLWAVCRHIGRASCQNLLAALTDTQARPALDEPDDDVLVFLKLHAIGPEHVKRLESRRAGPWDVMFNPIRALRPPRTSGMKFESLLRPFDPAGFHFNKSFLAREILWEGELSGKPTRLLNNKFPSPACWPAAPEPVRELSAMPHPGTHGWAWDLCAESRRARLAWATTAWAPAHRSTTALPELRAGESPADAGWQLCPQRRRPPTRCPAGASPTHRSLVPTRRCTSRTCPTPRRRPRESLHLVDRVPRTAPARRSLPRRWLERMAGASRCSAGSV